jgi:putative redox protein
MSDSLKIEFPGHSGQLLAARLDLPDRPRAFALFAHCFTCGKDIFAAARIAERLTAQGIAVLRFDFTGLGSSEGEFANTNFSSNVQDLLAAVAFLRANYRAPSLLIGHSLGGAAVLSAAPHVPEAVGVATLCAPSSAAHVTHLFTGSIEEIEKTGKAEVMLSGRPFTIEKQFLDDVASADFLSGLAHLKKALLVCHAPLDETVGIENANTIFQAAHHPKSFVSLDTADHLLRKRADAVYAADMIGAWASRFLPEIAAEEAPLEPGLVTVTETRTGRYANEVRAGRHHLSASEPEDIGGDDSGPGPFDYLLASLGACTSITLRMYAERKQIPVERIGVALRMKKIEGEGAEITEMSREIALEGDLSQDDRERLLAIAERCPVHRTLTHEIRIRSALAGS